MGSKNTKLKQETRNDVLSTWQELMGEDGIAPALPQGCLKALDLPYITE